MAVPLARPVTLTLDLPDEAATAALAGRIAGRARAGDVIALIGDLGTGKTAFARAFVNALGRPAGAPGGAEEVPSPTFTLVQVYERAPAPVWHVDLYRLERPEEAAELGLEEALVQAITLVEWPERLGPRLPADRLEVRLDFAEEPGARRATLVAGPAWARRLRGLGNHA